MASPIANDLVNINSLVQLGQAQQQALLSQVAKRQTLITALTSNVVFSTTTSTIIGVLSGYVNFSGIPYIIINKTPYFGSRNSYLGNTQDFLLSASGHTSIDYNALVGTYAGTSIPMILGSLTTSFPTSTFIFLTNQFSFINKYLWADPSNPALSAFQSDPNMQYGLNYNAKTLFNAATSLQNDAAFYQNKLTYLSNLG